MSDGLLPPPAASSTLRAADGTRLHALRWPAERPRAALLLSHGGEPATPFPWFGDTLPWWILAILFGRELFITLFRGYAAKRGVVLAAGRAGKLKAVFQNIAIGAAIFWYALLSASREHGWDTRFWNAVWVPFHRWFCILSLTIAVVLTLWSLGVYLNSFRTLDLERKAAP